MKLLLIENPTNQIINIIRKTINNNQRSLIAAEAILQADPTPKKKYIKWLANILKKGHIKVSKAFSPPSPQIILPEDNPRVHQVINTFEKAKPRLPHDQRNILSFKDFYTIENLLDKLVSTAQVRTGGMVKNIPGAEVIYNKEPYTLYLVNKIRKIPYRGGEHTEDEKERIKAIEILGMGPPETKWCTRSNYSTNSMAAHYLAKNDMFVVYKNGVPFAQKCGRELRDVNDRMILPDELDFIYEAEKEEARKKKEKHLKRIKPIIAKHKDTPNLIMTINSTKPHKYVRLIDMGNFTYVLKKRNTVWQADQEKYTPHAKRLHEMGIIKITELLIDCEQCGTKSLKKDGPKFAQIPEEEKERLAYRREGVPMHLNREPFVDRVFHDHMMYYNAECPYEYFTVNNANIVLQT